MDEKNKPKKPNQAKEDLKKRVRAVKKGLPKDWRNYLRKGYPNYDSLEYADLLTRVHACRAADEPLTVILESIASEYQAELVKKERYEEKTIRRQKNYIPPTI